MKRKDARCVARAEETKRSQARHLPDLEAADPPISFDERDPDAFSRAIRHAVNSRTLADLETSYFRSFPPDQARRLMEILYETLRGPIADFRLSDNAEESAPPEGVIESAIAKMWAVMHPDGDLPPLPDKPTVAEIPDVDTGSDRSIVRWETETGFFTTAPMAVTKDTGIAALVVFESEAQMKRNLPLLEGGPDLCWVGFQAPLTKSQEAVMNTPSQKMLRIISGVEVGEHGREGRPGITIVGQSRRGFLLRESGGEVFVEVIDPKQKGPGQAKRIRVRTLDGGGVVHLLGKKGKKEGESTLPLFIRKRERLRQRDEVVVIPSRADHLVRSVISTSGTKLHEEAIRKTLEVFTPSPTGEDLLATKKASSVMRLMARANPAEALEVTIGLLDKSRRALWARDSESKGKRRKTRAFVQTTDPLPFDETKIEIVVGTMKQVAADKISDQFFQTLQKSLDTSLMQTLLAVFAQAYQSGGAFVQNVDALLRLRHGGDGGFQRTKILAELETLGTIQFRLATRSKERLPGDQVAYRWMDFPILHRGVVKGRTLESGEETVDSVKWWIDADFLQTLQVKRHFALIDRSLLALDAHREEWEFRLGVAISTRWSKGWLGNEHLSLQDGRTEWTVERLVDTAGLGLNARKWIEKWGVDGTKKSERPPFRVRFRQALETLMRCGPSAAQTIGGFEIIRDRSGDPLLDRVIVWPTEGQVEEWRERFIGRAEQKALEAPKGDEKARRPVRKRKADR